MRYRFRLTRWCLLCGEMSHRLKEVIDSTVVIGAKFATCLQNLER